MSQWVDKKDLIFHQVSVSSFCCTNKGKANGILSCCARALSLQGFRISLDSVQSNWMLLFITGCWSLFVGWCVNWVCLCSSASGGDSSQVWWDDFLDRMSFGLYYAGWILFHLHPTTWVRYCGGFLCWVGETTDSTITYAFILVCSRSVFVPAHLHGVQTIKQHTAFWNSDMLL